jgi:hypothetical protein
MNYLINNNLEHRYFILLKHNYYTDNILEDEQDEETWERETIRKFLMKKSRW